MRNKCERGDRGRGRYGTQQGNWRRSHPPPLITRPCRRRATSSSRNINPRPNELCETSPRGWRPGTSTPRSSQQPTPHTLQNYWPTRQSSARQASDSHRSCGCAMTSPRAPQHSPPPTPPSDAVKRTPISQVPTTSPLPHPCRDFNNGVCRCPVCRFRHTCTRCGERSHGERDCPSSR